MINAFKKAKEKLEWMKLKGDTEVNEAVSFSLDKVPHPTALALHIEDLRNKNKTDRAPLMLEGLRKLANMLVSDSRFESITIVTATSGYSTRKRHILEDRGFKFDNTHERANAEIRAYDRRIVYDENGLTRISEENRAVEPIFAWISKDAFVKQLKKSDKTPE